MSVKQDDLRLMLNELIEYLHLAIEKARELSVHPSTPDSHFIFLVENLSTTVGELKMLVTLQDIGELSIFEDGAA